MSFYKTYRIIKIKWLAALQHIWHIIFNSILHNGNCQFQVMIRCEMNECMIERAGTRTMRCFLLIMIYNTSFKILRSNAIYLLSLALSWHFDSSFPFFFSFKNFASYIFECTDIRCYLHIHLKWPIKKVLRRTPHKIKRNMSRNYKYWHKVIAHRV